jgi:large subunit ribosomal protein L18
MASRDSKNVIRLRIHTRIRRKVKGTPERPRLAVFRSVKHIYAQVIDDTAGHTVVAASSSEKATAMGKSGGGNMSGAKAIGKLVAERAKDKGIKDRGVRPRRVSLSRPRESAGRGGP